MQKFILLCFLFTLTVAQIYRQPQGWRQLTSVFESVYLSVYLSSITISLSAKFCNGPLSANDTQFCFMFTPSDLNQDANMGWTKTNDTNCITSASGDTGRQIDRWMDRQMIDRNIDRQIYRFNNSQFHWCTLCRRITQNHLQ